MGFDTFWLQLEYSKLVALIIVAESWLNNKVIGDEEERWNSEVGFAC